MSTDPISIVIIDWLHSFGCGLRNALSSSNVTAHVFDSYAPALLLMQSKTIDGVVVKFDTDPETEAFLETAKNLGITVVFSDSPTILPQMKCHSLKLQTLVKELAI